MKSFKLILVLSNIILQFHFDLLTVQLHRKILKNLFLKTKAWCAIITKTIFLITQEISDSLSPFSL